MTLGIPKSHLMLEEDLPLIQLCHVFAQGSIWLSNGMYKQVATYDLFVRDMPAARNFMVAAGLEEILTWLGKLRFSEEDIALLKEAGFISDEFGEYLRQFRFTGTVFALKEGTVFFPYEPVVRVTAPLIEASVIETYLMSALASNVPFATKAARLKLAIGDKIRLTVGPFRAHSFESGMKASRAALFYGINSLGNFSVAKKYGLPVPKPPIIAQHLFIKSFSDELSAFRAITRAYPGRGAFMVDTYDFEQGIENAVRVFGELKADGHPATAVVIDSGDIIQRAKYARQKLDAAGFTEAKIVLGGNIDELKLLELVEKNTPCDLALSVTEYVTLSDSPKLEVVYKLAELRLEDKVHYAAKLTPGKLSYPGRKQVYRTFNADGVFSSDVIGLDNENPGEPLLEKVMERGKVVKPLPPLSEIQQHAMVQLSKLPSLLRDIRGSQPYNVAPSQQLEKLLQEVRKVHIA